MNNQTETMLFAITEDPENAFVVADYLDEEGDKRGELLRLLYTLTRRPEVDNRANLEERLRDLIRQGVCYPGPYKDFPITEGVSLRTAWIMPGTFMMGSPETEEGRYDDEIYHRVRLTQGYWIATTPITQAQWKEVMGDNPSHFQGDDRPVETVSWDDAQNFCKKLSELLDMNVQLPTEAQWEYACRAGTTTPFHFGTTITHDLANFDGGPDTLPNGEVNPYKNQTTPVGIFPPNGFGLYDMHGNVWEWCRDAYGSYDDITPEDRDPFVVTTTTVHTRTAAVPPTTSGTGPSAAPTAELGLILGANPAASASSEAVSHDPFGPLDPLGIVSPGASAAVASTTPGSVSSAAPTAASSGTHTTTTTVTSESSSTEGEHRNPFETPVPSSLTEPLEAAATSTATSSTMPLSVGTVVPTETKSAASELSSIPKEEGELEDPFDPCAQLSSTTSCAEVDPTSASAATTQTGSDQPSESATIHILMATTSTASESSSIPNEEGEHSDPFEKDLVPALLSVAAVPTRAAEIVTSTVPAVGDFTIPKTTVTTASESSSIPNVEGELADPFYQGWHTTTTYTQGEPYAPPGIAAEQESECATLVTALGNRLASESSFTHASSLPRAHRIRGSSYYSYCELGGRQSRCSQRGCAHTVYEDTGFRVVIYPK